MFMLTIDTDNAVFEDSADARGNSHAREVVRLIRLVAVKLEQGHTLPISLRDVNGNTVGEATHTD